MTSDLQQINAAIEAIESGAQEYRIADRLVRRGDLKALYEERRRLKAEMADENGYRTTVAVFDRR